jgi:1,4-alpha-glucan branching enzyme
VIYELHVASFYRPTTKPANFIAIIKKLDYLVSLGINAIEILPVSGFPDDFSLGYDPTFPFDIESSYGGPHEFKDFVKAAHKKGIAIIMDIVLNHFGGNDLITSLYRFDGWSENGKCGMYFYNDWRSVTGFGDRPDYGRPEVRAYLMDNVKMWLEEYHLDGLRFDSTVNIRNVYGKNNDPADDLPDGWSLMQWINNTIDDSISWKLTIAEDLQDNQWITLDTASGGADFDSQWDAASYWKLFYAIVTANDADRNMFDIRDALAHSFEGDICKRVVFSNNHDQCAAINNNVRLPERIWPGHADSWASRKRSTLAAAIVFTTPGIPMIFQGDEFLEWGSWDPSVEIDWSKVTQFAGILNLYKDLIHLRRNISGNATGFVAGLTGQYINVFHVNNNDKVIAYHRWQNGGEGDDVIIVANFANTSYDSYTIGFPKGGNWNCRFNSDWSGYSGDFSDKGGYDTTASPDPADGLNFSGNIGIGPYSVIILSQ